MKFLDLNGLTHFFGKVKTWAGNNYLSLKGGSIDGSVVINNEENVALRVLDGDKEVTISPTRITMGYSDETPDSGSSIVYNLDMQDGNITAESFTRIGGTATQVLIANGSVREIGSANGIAGLDANGYVPLAQLGNLDTTVAEVVTALPTTNIKKHIYLIKDTDGVTQNQYEEYIYTGDTSTTYDASKWEKLGNFRGTVDLADYAKKSETLSDLVWEQRGSSLFLAITMGDGISVSEFMPTASSSTTGAMSNTDKVKLDGIEARANNYFLPLATANTRGGIKVGYVANGRNYPVQMDGEKAYVNVPWTDTNTTYDLSPYAKTADVNAALAKKVDVVSGKGLSTHDFTSAYKSKLDGISSGATADSAITTAEIDALFT